MTKNRQLEKDKEQLSWLSQRINDSTTPIQCLSYFKTQYQIYFNRVYGNSPLRSY